MSPREAMLAFLDELRAAHGSVAGYASAIGVTDEHVAAMRAHLLMTPRKQAAPSDHASRVMNRLPALVTLRGRGWTQPYGSSARPRWMSTRD